MHVQKIKYEMNKVTVLLALSLLSVSLIGCKEKKTNDIIVSKVPQRKGPAPIQHMSEYKDIRTTEWLGTTYKVDVRRSYDTSLPIVHVDDNRYYDNQVKVRILRKDGSEFFSRTFTKSNFKNWLPDKIAKNGALLGVVFVEASGDCLNFAVSVGSPDVTSDEYVPLVLKLSRYGVTSVSSDQQLDTSSNKSDEGDDEEVTD